MVLRDGAVMAYYVRKGLGPTLVLIPGTYDDKSRFLAPGYVDQLRPDLGLVVVEHRGQGASWPPPPRDKCSVEEYANDVLAVVDQLKPSFWYVSGHSLGGMLAIEIAKALHRPDVKEKLATLGLDTYGTTPEEFAAFMKSESDRFADAIRFSGTKIE
ncbi:MAG: alpha/beta hydrolase [bacterium]